MKVYYTHNGILVAHQSKYHLLRKETWDDFINDDAVISNTLPKLTPDNEISDASSLMESGLRPPVQSQEIWASGVTYYNSKLGREEESKNAGGSSFYSKVYEAERPELFFKATAHRTVGQGGKVRIRKDSHWNVPEPELTLAITSKGKIIGSKNSPNNRLRV